MHSHSNAPALALRAIGMHPKYAGYGYSLAILRITHRHPEYIYRLPKMVYPISFTQNGLSKNYGTVWLYAFRFGPQHPLCD